MIEKNKIYDLMDSWERMNSELCDDMFDYEFFKSTIKETFEILFEYREDEMISKDMLGLVLKLSAFGTNPTGGVSDEADAAKLTACELCTQFSECWVGTGNGVEKSTFVVAAENGSDCFINTETFDLAEVIDNNLELN